jgi:ribulose-phosphate 3-epimerase
MPLHALFAILTAKEEYIGLSLYETNRRLTLKGVLMAHIFPSIISANLLNLQADIEQLAPFCDGFHIDIMDNHFVPNLTMGAAFANAIGQLNTKPLWLHLMVDNPASIIRALTIPAGSIISFHIESKEDHLETINIIKEKNYLPSITIKPKTGVERIFPLLNVINQVLLMSVEPGFSGQLFLESTTDKLDQLTSYRSKSTHHFRIGIDGGINEKNIRMLAQKGVDDFGVAAAIFNAPNQITALKTLKKLITI